MNNSYSWDKCLYTEDLIMTLQYCIQVQNNYNHWCWSYSAEGGVGLMYLFHKYVHVSSRSVMLCIIKTMNNVMLALLTPLCVSRVHNTPAGNHHV